MKNKMIMAVNTIWVVLTALNESGILELLPFENEKISGWIKWIIAFVLIIANAAYFQKNTSKTTVQPNPEHEEK